MTPILYIVIPCYNEEAVLPITAPLYCVGLTLAQMLAEVSDRYHYSLLPMLVLLAAVSGRTMKGERT